MFQKGHVPWNKGKRGIYSEETLCKIRKARARQKMTKKTREKISKALLGRPSPVKGMKFSKETRLKMKKSRLGKLNPMFGSTGGFSGKTHSPETLQKMRLSAIKRIERNKGQVQPNYNPEACRAIEEYGKQHGYNFQHAENGGEFYIKELGYWVDGYDKDKNVAVEYDESYHLRQPDKDHQRQLEIEEYLGCKFIRIS